MNMLLGPHVRKGAPFLRAENAFTALATASEQSVDDQIALLKGFNHRQSCNPHC
jgi:hypothetical protein